VTEDPALDSLRLTGHIQSRLCRVNYLCSKDCILRIKIFLECLLFSFHMTSLTYFDRFKIQDDEIGKDDLAAWACIRLDRLRRGLRLVHLRDAAGMESQGVLLVGIGKTLV